MQWNKAGKKSGTSHKFLELRGRPSRSAGETRLGLVSTTTGGMWFWGDATPNSATLRPEKEFFPATPKSSGVECGVRSLKVLTPHDPTKTLTADVRQAQAPVSSLCSFQLVLVPGSP